MGVAVGGAPPKGGSGPSSPQSLVSRSTSSSVGSNDSERTKKEKPQPTVDAMSMPKVESHGPEIRPNDERKPETKHVRDDGRTFAANTYAPYVGPQYMPPLSQLYYPQPQYVVYGYNETLDKDHEIANLQDLLSDRDQTITELKMQLENKKEEVCAIDNSLREKEEELASCRRNLDHCQTKNRRLKEKLRASEGNIVNEKEQQKKQLAQCAERHQEQWRKMNQQWEADYNQLLFVRQREVERSGRLEQQLLHEMADNKRLAEQLQLLMANARERTRTHPDESPIPQNGSQDVTQLGQNNGNQQDVNVGVSINPNSGVLPNRNTNNATSFVSSGNASSQAALAVSQISASSQTDQDLTRSDAKYEHDTSVDGQALHSGHLDVHINPETEPYSVISPLAGAEQVLSQENDADTISIYWGSTGLTSEIRLDTIGQNSAKEQENVNLTDHGLREQVAKVKEPSFNADASGSQ